MPAPPQRILLASASPRRLQLLRQLGLQPEVLMLDLDESPRPDETISEQVCRLATEKAAQGWQRAGADPGCLAIGADTLIELDGRALGKPADADEACAMLVALGGRSHQVLSAVAVCSGITRVRLSRSRVRFRAISENEARAYWRSGEPKDKAGGYAIQGLGAIFVKTIIGSYSGVMGLPLFETAVLLEEFGVTVLESWNGHRQA